MTKMRTRVPIRLAFVIIAGTLAGACDQNTLTDVETVRLAVVSGADHGGAPFRTAMTQEVTTTPVWAGDPDGTGEALITINRGLQEICWQTSVSDIVLPATASHIHRAAAGVRGGIVVGLSAPDATATAAGCRTGVDRDLLNDILTSPEEFYVNVHTTDYPAGAVRGQFKR
jgi:hypothetical protein